jgi:ATP-dependent RNA helicase SUPV3L1/SUV3
MEELVSERLGPLKSELTADGVLESLGLEPESLDKTWTAFEQAVIRDVKQRGYVSRPHRNMRDLDNQLKYRFFDQIFFKKFTETEKENQRKVADLRYPGEWYPGARSLSRTIHLHVGPTNSGKTYHALRRLEQAEAGCYLGPLRLLAHEIYSRMNAKGIACALITGEEMRLPDEPFKMTSCTVEMAPVRAPLDVAVIDEIQMVSHEDRGWAWTAALLGLRAKEIHVCGEERAVPIVRELCAMVGDKVVVHRYDRLTPLHVSKHSLRGDLSNLQKGDCIVSFSVLGIHALRKEIEQRTGRKVAIVYGSLPPETRAQQAKLFNDPDNDYDFLVASDAIGMGLNLNIKRVVFEAVSKWNGESVVNLTVSETKQIGGRAGRYKTSHEAISESASERTAVGESTKNSVSPVIDIPPPPKSSNVGYVTTLDSFDLPMLKKKMNQMPEPIKTAGILPPPLVVERFANYFPPGTPFSYILLRLHGIAGTHGRYHLCDLKDNTRIADCIQPLTNLTIQDRLIICNAPANMRVEAERIFMYTLAECIAEEKSGNLLDLENLNLELLDLEPSGERSYLQSLEGLHKNIILYLWLSYRFPNVFTTRSLAEHTKKLVEDRIERCLQEFSFIPTALRAAKRKKQQAMMKEATRLQEEAERQRGIQDATMLERGAAEEDAGVLTGFDTDDVDKYPTDAIDDPDITMSELHRHRQHSRLQHTKLRFGDFATLEEISALASGYGRRLELLKRNVEDVKTGYVSGIDLNVDPIEASHAHM